MAEHPGSKSVQGEAPTRNRRLAHLNSLFRRATRRRASAAAGAADAAALLRSAATCFDASSMLVISAMQPLFQELFLQPGRCFRNCSCNLQFFATCHCFRNCFLQRDRCFGNCFCNTTVVSATGLLFRELMCREGGARVRGVRSDGSRSEI